jgi:hypothetical protein
MTQVGHGEKSSERVKMVNLSEGVAFSTRLQNRA